MRKHDSFGQRHTAWLMHIHRLGPRCEWHSHLGAVLKYDDDDPPKGMCTALRQSLIQVSPTT